MLLLKIYMNVVL